MTRILRTMVVGVLLMTGAAAARADDKPVIPLRVQLVISRYQGEKKISSLPYTIMVTANGGKTSLRMGAQVPVMTGPSFSYRDIGVNIDCNALAVDDGRFKIDISVDDSSVYGDESAPRLVPDALSKPASFRQLRITGGTVLKDGQTAQFTSATDKTSGEVTKIDLTVSVAK